MCDKGVFSVIVISQHDDQMSSNFHRFVILCICWDIPSEKTCLWQLPIVSSVFNSELKTFPNGQFLQCCFSMPYRIITPCGINIPRDRVYTLYDALECQVDFLPLILYAICTNAECLVMHFIYSVIPTSLHALW